MIITQKDDYEVYDKLRFCLKILPRNAINRTFLRLNVSRGRVMGSDGKRLHYTYIKNIPEGLYNYRWEHGVSTLLKTEESIKEYPKVSGVIPKKYDFIWYINKQFVIDRALNQDFIKYGYPYIDWMFPGVTIRMQCKFIASALVGMAEPITVKIQSKEKKPVLITDTVKFALLMPMRIY